jgi:hypothetical protein
MNDYLWILSESHLKSPDGIGGRIEGSFPRLSHLESAYSRKSIEID